MKKWWSRGKGEQSHASGPGPGLSCPKAAEKPAEGHGDGQQESCVPAGMPGRSLGVLPEQAQWPIRLPSGEGDPVSPKMRPRS